MKKGILGLLVAVFALMVASSAMAYPSEQGLAGMRNALENRNYHAEKTVETKGEHGLVVEQPIVD